MINEDVDIDTVKQYLQADPSLLTDIYNMMKYRELRTEQVYYAHLAYEYDHVDIMRQSKIVRNAGNFDRSGWTEKSIKLDKNRRATHNKALISFNSILRTGKLCKLPEIYNGKTLTNEEIVGYLRAERREEITDSMFEFLNIIEDGVIENEISRQNSELKKIKSDMKNFNKMNNVSKSLMKDESTENDGGIEFDFSNAFNNSQEIEFDFSSLSEDKKTEE